LSKAIITNDIDRFLKAIKAWEIVRRDELKVDDIAFIKQKAYISDNNKRLIVIAAEKFNIYAQNALLKLIEEPPKNIDFLIVTNSKHSLLDTLLSRVFVEKRSYKKDNFEKLKSIANEYILEILDSKKEKEEIKEFLYDIVKQKELNEEQMEIITKSMKMLELNLDKESVLALVMLSLKVKK